MTNTQLLGNFKSVSTLKIITEKLKISLKFKPIKDLFFKVMILLLLPESGKTDFVKLILIAKDGTILSQLENTAISFYLKPRRKQKKRSSQVNIF